MSTTTAPQQPAHRSGRAFATATLVGVLMAGGFTAPASAVNTPTDSSVAVSLSDSPKNPTGPFKDVPANHPHAKSIQWVKDQGILSGYRDGTFRPNKITNRTEVAVALYRYAGSPRYNAPKVSPFRDVRTSHPHYKEIAWAQAKGLLTVHRGWFVPHLPVSHGETASAYYKFSGSPGYDAPAQSQVKDMKPRDRYYKEIHWAKETGIFKGSHARPYKPTTRGELASDIHNWWMTWQ